ncbi:hypothetical protein CHU92_14175 [Flavobacterium cyanobacteriorum]|uniref:DUF6671 domain-containing protein n=1 Tax=Flavobacterium cyanobacteriorum TaxID=2022802 RepID=A0A255YSS4_9FLAO|nr:DUF6671 family protein [Flavobacterium cyanobacteriorum]OYQ32231.1 hypothetical protein CHU92_14175 [Flavobacterium cyanobacteriorum]
MFAGRKLLIVTKHSKETVMAPLLEQGLGVECVVASGFDTDLLGTFAGEIERQHDPLTTAREKCNRAMDMLGYDLAIASEGSFGPHPSIFFASADDELVLLADRKNGLEIKARELSVDTNFNGKTIKSISELKDFAAMAKFPTHALILKKAEGNLTDMVKGITDEALLTQTFSRFYSQYGSAYAETDMRAMHNPTRMAVIATAVRKLVEKALTLCPVCQTPGYGVTEIRTGLPCSLCGYPTKSVLSHIYQCAKCFHSDELYYPNSVKTEDPMYCDICNP